MQAETGADRRWLRDEERPDGRWVYTWTDDFTGVSWWDNGIATRHEVEPELVQGKLEGEGW